MSSDCSTGVEMARELLQQESRECSHYTGKELSALAIKWDSSARPVINWKQKNKFELCFPALYSWSFLHEAVAAMLCAQSPVCKYRVGGRFFGEAE